MGTKQTTASVADIDKITDLQSTASELDDVVANYPQMALDIANMKADIITLNNTVANLASAQGKVGNDVAQEITTTETDLQFDKITESSDVSIFEIDEATDTFIFKRAGHYNTQTNATFNSSTNSQVVCDFDWVNVANDDVITTRQMNFDLGNNVSDSGSLSNLIVLEEGDVPMTLKITTRADRTGIAIGGFGSTIVVNVDG